MDYEKKYKDALERAREIKEKIMYSHLSTESCKAVSEYIDTIIPELTESEDERIRMELVAFFKGMQDSDWHEKYWHDLEIDRILAYLEKQKEPKKKNVLPSWKPSEEQMKAFKRGQEANHEDYLRGYTNGYEDAEKEYQESKAYHFPIMPTTPVFGCDGIHCTNPQMDCINCPRRTTGGSFCTSSASGTSTLKAEG